MSSKNLTLYIPADLAKKMEKLPEVNWSKIAQHAIESYVEDRLQSSIPSETLIKLRKEKGQEFANGKKYAVERILPTIMYKKLADFFHRAQAEAESERRNYAAAHEMPIEVLGLYQFYKEVSLRIIRWFFGKLPEDTSEEFAKGVLSIIRETWKKLEEKK